MSQLTYYESNTDLSYSMIGPEVNSFEQCQEFGQEHLKSNPNGGWICSSNYKWKPRKDVFGCEKAWRSWEGWAQTE